MKEKSIQQLINLLSFSKIAKERRPVRTDTHERFDDNPHYNYKDEGSNVRGQAKQELLRRGASIADELCQALGNDRSYTTAFIGSVKAKLVGDTIASILVEMGPDVIPVVRRYVAGGEGSQIARANWVLCQLGDVEGCLRFSVHIKSQLKVDLDRTLSAQNADQVEMWLIRALRAADPGDRPGRHVMQAIMKKSKDDKRYRKILAGAYVYLSEVFERAEAKQILGG